MSVLFNHVFPSTVISTSPSGRYVLSGTDPNAKTWIVYDNTKNNVISVQNVLMFKIKEVMCCTLIANPPRKCAAH